MNEQKQRLTDRPDLMAEWDFDKNSPLLPDGFSMGSNKKVYWICPKGHSYGPKAIYERTRQDGKATGCPYCANKKVLPGYNSLQDLRPDVLCEWDYDKNDKLPSEYVAHTDKKVFWKCSKGHSYQMRICDKTKEKPYGCPVCSNKQLLTGYNDLKTLFPKLAEEWDYENNLTGPEEHIPGDHVKVSWVCSHCGNRWITSIKERAYHGTGCPSCAFYFKTSSPEQAVFYYVRQLFPDAINSYSPNYLNRMEIDIYIPTLRMGIEYDGKAWHSNKKRDEYKSKLLKENGIQLIRIRESSEENLFDDFAVLKSAYKNNLKELEPVINELFLILKEHSNSMNIPSIDLERDAPAIYAMSEGNKQQRSLASSGEKVLQEWAYDLNGALTPDKVTPGSRKTAYWRCSKCGFVWQQPIKQKVKAGLGCEHCNKTEANLKRTQRKIALGEIKTIADYPDLLKEWNDPRDPATVSDGNDKHALWKCSVCGYEFKQIVKNRTRQGQGCPRCGRINQAKTRGYAVINVVTGEEYWSIAEAERQTGIAAASIRQCCNGVFQQAGGYRWKYADKHSQK